MMDDTWAVVFLSFCCFLLDFFFLVRFCYLGFAFFFLITERDENAFVEERERERDREEKMFSVLVLLLFCLDVMRLLSGAREKKRET
jgi:hypothetical protein